MTENFETIPGRAERNIVYKTRSGKNLIARRPIMDSKRGNHKRTMQEEVRRAVTYAEFACEQPIYQCKAVGTTNSAYNLAVADALGKPQVLDIDIHGWNRNGGRTLLVKARDNFLVLSVHVVIREGDSILEEADAEQSELDGLIWKYPLQTPLERRPGLTVDAYAYDLPGNVGKHSIELR
jgi:hypothetical protein